MKVGIKLGKVKKFGIGWCIPHRVVADNAPPHRIGLKMTQSLPPSPHKKEVTLSCFNKKWVNFINIDIIHKYKIKIMNSKEKKL